MTGDQPSRFNTGNLTKFREKDIAEVREFLQNEEWAEAANRALVSVINSHMDALIATVMTTIKGLRVDEFEASHILNKVIRDNHLQVDSHSRAMIIDMVNPIFWNNMCESDARAMDEMEKQMKEMEKK